jgi:hypothetical protein
MAMWGRFRCCDDNPFCECKGPETTWEDIQGAINIQPRLLEVASSVVKEYYGKKTSTIPSKTSTIPPNADKSAEGY